MEREIKERIEKHMKLKRNKEKDKKRKILKNEIGITLVALVVTVVILIILATISMVAVFGENGLITKSQQGRGMHEQGKDEEQNRLDMYAEYSGKYLNGVGTGGRPVEPETPKGPNGKPLVNKDTIKTTEHETIIGEDTLGNQVVVPKGFKIAEESGTSVKEGIVIEDEIGNQFVWIPVSNIDKSGSNKIKVNSKDEEGVEITLGRYTFADKNATDPGKATIIQKGSEYDKTVNESNNNETYKIKGDGDYYMYEFSQSRLTNYKSDKTGTNTTAKDLKGFIESVRDNQGYYIGRYEASFGSGEENPDASKVNTAEYITNQKPLSKESTKHTRASGTEKLEEGMLWNYINQGDAAKVCRNMYTGEAYGVESDLLNSYMWDTAVVYIQEMGHANYANANRDTNGNTTLKNTGKETKDEVCHIYDMAGNLLEWTTEYCTDTTSSGAYPCTDRGGRYSYSKNYVIGRYVSNAATNSLDFIGFRSGLYIK